MASENNCGLKRKDIIELMLGLQACLKYMCRTFEHIAFSGEPIA
jgi:hypothetical protein